MSISPYDIEDIPRDIKEACYHYFATKGFDRLRPPLKTIKSFWGGASSLGISFWQLHSICAFNHEGTIFLSPAMVDLIRESWKDRHVLPIYARFLLLRHVSFFFYSWSSVWQRAQGRLKSKGWRSADRELSQHLQAVYASYDADLFACIYLDDAELCEALLFFQEHAETLSDDQWIDRIHNTIDERYDLVRQELALRGCICP